MLEAELNLLREHGVNVTTDIVSNDAIGGMLSALSAGVSAVHNSQQAARIKAKIQDGDYDVVHFHNFFPLLSPSVHKAAWQAGAAVVQTLHNYRLLCANAQFLREGQVCEKCVGRSAIPGVWHRCYRGSAAQSAAVGLMIETSRLRGIWNKYVNRFIALTDFARNKFIEGGLPADRVVVKSNFVTDRGPPPCAEGRNGVLFVGRLSKEKGVDILLQSWQNIPDINLTIVGDGPERQALEKRATSNVEFKGHLNSEQVRAQMHKASVLVMPSIWYEGFPVTLVEAYESGLPVIASRIGSLTELIVEGETGQLFNPGDRVALTKTVTDLFSRPNELVQMSSNARRLYLSSYTPHANFISLMSIYEESRILRRQPNNNNA